MSTFGGSCGSSGSRYRIRPFARRPPLLRAIDSFHAYRKGPFALYALSEYMGEERVNAGIPALDREAQFGSAATADVARPLSGAPGGHAGLVPVSAARPLRGEHLLGARDGAGHGGADRIGHLAGDARVQARKVVVDEAGVETEVPMDE